MDTAQPARVVRHCTKPFRWWIIDEYMNVPRKILIDAYESTPGPDWPGWKARYDNELEKGKRTVSHKERAKLDRSWGVIFDYLHGPGIVPELERLSGVQGLQIDSHYHGTGIHVMDPGGWLNCHLDYALNPFNGMERRLNLVLFLNPVWDSFWGGTFEMYDDDARNPYSDGSNGIGPAFNRAVIWESSDIAYHGVSHVRSEVPRVTVAATFLAPPRPGCVRKRALFCPNRGS